MVSSKMRVISLFVDYIFVYLFLECGFSTITNGRKWSGLSIREKITLRFLNLTYFSKLIVSNFLYNVLQQESVPICSGLTCHICFVRFFLSFNENVPYFLPVWNINLLMQIRSYYGELVMFEYTVCYIIAVLFGGSV